MEGMMNLIKMLGDEMEIPVVKGFFDLRQTKF